MLPVIVIPTYNEKENIERMVRQLMAMDIGVSVLIADDNSPDGTGEIADRLSEEFPQVSVLHRERKEGLGNAYRNGFEVALDMGADYVFQMDADFSHDPRYVPQMLEAGREHDVVIGSRYVEGGGTRNWGLGRRLISRSGGVYTRAVTGIKIMDPTAGFRCFSADALRRIDFSRISASGYGFQVELSYVCTILGMDIFELPIVFADRTEGTSKMSKSIVWEALWLVGSLKRKYRDITKAPGS
ncbi:MAG: polyprenol monophosphomannose synthase [Candidatus Geothermincolia bacterium]